jgi:hypothetical protein
VALTFGDARPSVRAVAEKAVSDQVAYRSRVLVYVDILGWRKLVAKSATDFSDMEQVGQAVVALKNSIESAEQLKGLDEELAPEVTVFSDTVVASCPPDPTAIELLLTNVQAFCLNLMAVGLYTRGAVVEGLLHHRDGVIVGPALVDAYLLESTVAKYPRVVVAGPVLERIRAVLQPPAFGPALVEDRDTLWVLDFFFPIEPRDEEFVALVRKRLDEALDKNPNDTGIPSEARLAEELHRLSASARVTRVRRSRGRTNAPPA